jgi:hypothetical protein
MTYQSPNHKENVKRYREKNKDKILDNGKTRYRNDSKRYLYHMLKRAETVSYTHLTLPTID